VFLFSGQNELEIVWCSKKIVVLTGSFRKILLANDELVLYKPIIIRVNICTKTIVDVSIKMMSNVL